MREPLLRGPARAGTRALLIAVAACTAAPSSTRGGTPTIRLASVDATAASTPGEVSHALRGHAELQLQPCLERAREAGASGAGHMDLSVAVDAEGSTMAAILHTNISDYEVTECVARALSGALVPTRGESYRIRVRIEAGS